MSLIMRKQVDIVNHPPRAADNDVLEAVHSVMHQLRSQQYRVLRDGPHQVTHMESKVLGYFGRHPGATQSELALHSGRDKAQLARLIKGLRDRGLLVALADAADRRQVQLSLSDAGLAVQRALQQQARRLATAAVAGLSSGEQQLLLALLRRVQANLEPRD
jgi:DNA-binding MarR family transcriptional regulator